MEMGEKMYMYAVREINPENYLSNYPMVSLKKRSSRILKKIRFRKTLMQLFLMLMEMVIWISMLYQEGTFFFLVVLNYKIDYTSMMVKVTLQLRQGLYPM